MSLRLKNQGMVHVGLVLKDPKGKIWRVTGLERRAFPKALYVGLQGYTNTYQILPYSLLNGWEMLPPTAWNTLYG